MGEYNGIPEDEERQAILEYITNVITVPDAITDHMQHLPSDVVELIELNAWRVATVSNEVVIWRDEDGGTILVKPTSGWWRHIEAAYNACLDDWFPPMIAGPEKDYLTGTIHALESAAMTFIDALREQAPKAVNLEFGDEKSIEALAEISKVETLRQALSLVVDTIND